MSAAMVNFLFMDMDSLVKVGGRQGWGAALALCVVASTQSGIESDLVDSRASRP
jgi:hypothetical protein